MIPIGIMVRAAAVAAIFASGVAVEHWRGSGVLARRDLAHSQAIDKIDQEARQGAEAQAEVFRTRARAYEAWKAIQLGQAARSNRRIQDEIDRNRSWADGPLPVGVRGAAEAAAAELGATEPGATVPAVPGQASAE